MGELGGGGGLGESDRRRGSAVGAGAGGWGLGRLGSRVGRSTPLLMLLGFALVMRRLFMEPTSASE
jgi:hypothetical protein